MEAIKKIVLLISISSLLFSFSAQATCVPRNHNHVAPRSSPAPKISVISAPNVAGPKATNIPSPKVPVFRQPAAPKAPVSAPKATVAAPKAPVPTPKAAVAAPKVPVSAPKDAATNNGELNRLCGLTADPAFCVAAVAPYLKGSQDSMAVLKAAMNAANYTLGIAISEAKKFASDPKTAPIVKSCISSCLENYESAVSDIESSFTAIDDEDIGSLNSNLDAALTMVGTCEDTFNENPGVESPMQKIDRKLSMMIDNCLAIRNDVKNTMSPPVVVW